ncbi:MAG: hypothetical protein AAFR59_05300, partial [Bacteroidota bacterium]
MRSIPFITILCLILFFSTTATQAQSLSAVYEAMESDENVTETLKKAQKDPKTRANAYILNILHNNVEGRGNSLEAFQSAQKDLEDPSAYIFPIWLSDNFIDPYTKMGDEARSFVEDVIKGDTYNGSIKAGAIYMLGVSYEKSFNPSKAVEVWKQVGSLSNWQLVGPFDNSSGSGFDKEYEPIAKPESDASFISKTFAPVKWFAPAYMQQDGWIFLDYHVPANSAVVYAQTFVNSPSDQEVILSYGGSGSFKVWVNDELALQEREEEVTELDVYKRKVKLNKGYNRILVQLGHANSENPNFCVRLLDAQWNPISNLQESFTYRPYTKAANTMDQPPMQHFAEAYFAEKIKQYPK